MTEQPTTDQTNTDTQFMVQRVYVKNLSFETTNTPAVFQQNWQPELSLDLHTAHIMLEQDIYEVSLTVTATVKNEKTTAFLIEVQQAGVFTIQGAEPAQMEHLLGSFCPSLLFPYAREAITTEVVRGSFPQLVLAPINFDALYIQQMEEKQKTAAAVDEHPAH